jgi:hypothetical protein
MRGNPSRTAQEGYNSSEPEFNKEISANDEIHILAKKSY